VHVDNTSLDAPTLLGIHSLPGLRMRQVPHMASGEREHLLWMAFTLKAPGAMLTAADTAYSIAVVRAQESDLPAAERLFEDPYAPVFAAAGAHAAEGTKRFLALPFFRDAIRLRTKGIDAFVREGLAAGLNQLVLLGAGFDTRGMRMPEIAAQRATVYEVDFAEQLEHKRALLAAAGVTLPAWIAHVGCDFKAPDFDAPLTAGLQERGFRIGAGAIFVWEGVLAYIGRDVVDRSLRFMARAGGPGSRLVFEFVPDVFEPETVQDRTRQTGFTACDEVAFDDLWRRYLPGEPHPNSRAIRLAMATV
jgi:methyltransferase (TIGR00027 family)